MRNQKEIGLVGVLTPALYAIDSFFLKLKLKREYRRITTSITYTNHAIDKGHKDLIVLDRMAVNIKSQLRDLGIDPD